MSKSQKNAIYNSALSFLSRRDYSRRELQAKLKTRFTSDLTDVEVVLDKLEADGYQSDRRFAEAFVRSRLQRGVGRVRLVRELKVKGISDWLIENVLADLLDENCDIESSHIYLAWEKKFKKYTNDPLVIMRQKRFLQYRGFEIDEINILMSHLKEQHENTVGLS